ncbi:UNVERIFIED_CONTAM: hypothetical protein HDU68_011084 [Siphonaria sp. JEL0065]|nr:hypothetical protein HDU68_011084 [Siphonaria sp. JEL0065]
MQFKGPGGFDLLDSPQQSFVVPSTPSPILGFFETSPVPESPRSDYCGYSPSLKPRFDSASSSSSTSSSSSASSTLSKNHTVPHRLPSHSPSSFHHQELHANTAKATHRFTPPSATYKKRHACPIEGCTKSFTKPNLLQTHINIHNQVKPFKCTVCPSEFARKHDLLRHFRHVHVTNEVEPCLKGCGKRFTRPDTRKVHEKTCF